MGTIFSETLVRLRKKAGFKTAYSFFHDNGGKGLLKVSYRMYLLIEQGKLMPPFESMGVYTYALRLVPGSYSAMEFVTAWLKTTLGEPGFKEILEPFLKLPQKQSVSSPLHKVAKNLLDQRKFYINPAQLRVIAKNAENYLCWTFFQNDTSAWLPKDMSLEMGVSAAIAERAMRELAAVKLLKRMKNGLYKCPLADSTMVEYPHGSNLAPEIRKKFQEFSEQLVSSGKPVFMVRGVLRASLTELSNCFPLLELNAATAATYAVTKKQKDSAIFAVECKVSKIRDF